MENVFATFSQKKNDKNEIDLTEMKTHLKNQFSYQN